LYQVTKKNIFVVILLWINKSLIHWELTKQSLLTIVIYNV